MNPREMKNINEKNVILNQGIHRRLSLITKGKLILVIFLLFIIISYRVMTMKISTDSKTVSSHAFNSSKENLLDGCRFVYIDMGTNVGMQFRKLYEPHLFPNAHILPIFKQYFGNYLNEVCSVGFEANPVHNNYLKQYENYCLKNNWRVKIFTSTAVSITEKNVTFYTEPENLLGKQGGSSLYVGSKIANVTVPSIDIISWIKNTVLNRKIPSGPPSPKILMKSDIEGHDPVVIANLVLRGVFCSIDFIYGEHFDHEFQKSISMLQKYSDSCPTKLIYMDDETYFNHTVIFT